MAAGPQFETKTNHTTSHHITSHHTTSHGANKPTDSTVHCTPTQVPFAIPPEFALIARAVGCLEGIALTGDPQYKMVLEAYPGVAVRALAASSGGSATLPDGLSEQSPLRELLMNSGDVRAGCMLG